MRKLLCLALFINLLGTLNAQQIYFSKRYDFGGSFEEDGYDINITNLGFIIKVAASNGTDLLFINDSGRIQAIKYLENDSINSYRAGGLALIRTNDGGYINGASIEDSAGNANVLLVKYNSVGDTVWTRQYRTTSFQSGWMAKQTRDEGFIITGQTFTSDPKGDVLLIKTDSLGNLQWQKHYGGGGYDLGISVDTCFDGGYLIAGYTESFGINPGNNRGNMYVIKTDSLGNLKWYRAPGGPYGESAWSCIQAKDGNYIVAGDTTYSESYYYSGDPIESYGKSYIIKLDTSGKTLWAKDYGPLAWDNYGIVSIKELGDGSLIAAGAYNDSTANFNERGLILKTDDNGDSLWYRTYAIVTGIHSGDGFWDIIPTNDGGFAASGTAYPSSPDTGSQDVWVLKVDSEGCEVMNCVINAVLPLSLKESGITVYPNPSNGIFYFNNHSFDEIKRIDVFNYLGEEILLKEGNVEQIDLSNAASGIYFYSISTKSGKIFKGKIIKE